MRFIVLCALLLSAPAFAAEGKSTSGGRYQLIQLSEFRRDQFLLDTQTGRVWKALCGKGTATDCSFTYWSEEIVEGLTMSGKNVQKLLADINKAD